MTSQDKDDDHSKVSLKTITGELGAPSTGRTAKTTQLQRVDLDHFKAFERFTLYLRGDAYLAGPNNAGKSTVIAAIRTAARMLSHAEQRIATYNVLDKGNRVVAHSFLYGKFGLVEENLRHEFHEVEARLSLRFRNGVRLIAVWPPDNLEPFFYLLDGDVSLRTPADVRRALPSIGIVPLLVPVEHEERSLTSKNYVRENLDGRLASRHFRNQLLLLEDEFEGQGYDAFLTFAEPWLPEIRLDRVRSRLAGDGLYLDLFFKESGSRIEKEIFWSGDGLQVWLQILLHIYRNQDCDLIILDEPDLFLHPDLQRRLVRLLESVGAQTVMATHSPEVLAESPPESVVWIDKSRKRSVLAPDSSVLNELMDSIGTQFNIRLARALRAKRVVFFEGDDMKLLRHLAQTLGALRVAQEIDIAVVPLRGYTNWHRIEPFVWLVRDLLRDSVDVFVALDRDYRGDGEVLEVKQRLAAVGVHAHVWRRKELESYFLEPRTVARVLGIAERDACDRLAAATEDLRDLVSENSASARAKLLPHGKRRSARIEVESRVADVWRDAAERIHLCPPKEVLARLNRQLEAEGRKALTFQRLARAMTADEIPDEIRGFLLRINDR